MTTAPLVAALAAALLLGGSTAQAATVAGVLTGSASTWDPSHATDSVSGDGLLSFTLYRRANPWAAAASEIAAEPANGSSKVSICVGK